MNNQTWKPLQHPMISDGYLISDKGRVRNKDCDESEYLSADYHSSNGYDFIMLIVKEEYRINNSLFMLFPIDELLGMTFIPIPIELKDKPITIKHINSDTRDITLDNLQWIEDIEEWRECTYPNVKPGMYEVSSWGRVRNKITGHLYSYQCDYHGYVYVDIKSNNDKWKHFYQHRLVCFQFNNQSFNVKYVVNHINGNPKNNIPKNLEWVTSSQNNFHAYSSKIKTPNKKFDDELVKNICVEIAKGTSSVEILEKYSDNNGLTLKTINGIKCKRQYKDISDNYFSRSDVEIKQSLSESEIKQICEILINSKMSIINTFRKLKERGINVSVDAIGRIKRKETYTNISDGYF